MIDEEKTFEMFGYTSDELTYGSHKKIVNICDGCGKERILVFQSYKDLCISCCRSGERGAHFGKPLSEETKRKISIKNSGENAPCFGRTGKNILIGILILQIKKDGINENILNIISGVKMYF